jgi:hypothetical protein
MENGKGKGERERIENGEWRMESGGWRMENGEWRTEDGGWGMGNGDWRLEIGRVMREWTEVTGDTLDGDLVTRWGDGRSSEGTRGHGKRWWFSSKCNTWN